MRPLRRITPLVAGGFAAAGALTVQFLASSSLKLLAEAAEVNTSDHFVFLFGAAAMTISGGQTTRGLTKAWTYAVGLLGTGLHVQSS